MPQLSLYIDGATLKKLEKAAKIEQLSVSRFAVKKLNEVLNATWPEHYCELFGSIKDESFSVSKSNSFTDDIARELL